VKIFVFVIQKSKGRRKAGGTLHSVKADPMVAFSSGEIEVKEGSYFCTTVNSGVPALRCCLISCPWAAAVVQIRVTLWSRGQRYAVNHPLAPAAGLRYFSPGCVTSGQFHSDLCPLAAKVLERDPEN
jgi:hypothetical protein